MNSDAIMKKFFAGLLLLALGAATGLSAPATSPADIYVNNSPLTTPPQVDATIFLNRSSFDISTTLPYTAQNVRFWTNTGSMAGTPGFRFENNRSGNAVPKKTKANSRNLQVPSATFHNDGNVYGEQLLWINANSIFTSGRLDGGEAGRIVIQATNGTADLSRSGIRVGPVTGINVPCGFEAFGTNFTPDPNIRELYWGAGRNNALGTNGQPLNLTSLPFANGGNFTLPFPRTPSHEVIQLFSGRPFTNLVNLPQGSFFGGLCGTNYDAYVHTNLDFAGTTPRTVVTIVFVPTQSLLSPDNLQTEVRFVPDFGPGGSTFSPVVEFHNTAFDIVDQAMVTNYVTFIDTTGSQTNVVLARPFTTITGTTPNTRRPSTHTFIRGRYCNFDFFTEAANAVYDPAVFFAQNNVTNIANTIYAASAAQIGLTNAQSFTATSLSPSGFLTLGANPAVTDPTNFTGKVEITAKDLDLTLTRIKAENFISIKAGNLRSNLVAQLDAPFIDLNLQSSNATLIISNLAPSSVNRLAGQIAAWSSAWNVNVTNVLGQTNAMRFHVLLVDNCLRSEQPVTINRFSVKTPQLVLSDNLFVNAGALVNAPAITVEPGATLALPLRSDWAFTNFQNLLNFTNNGTVSIQGGGYFGAFDVGHITIPKKKRGKKRPAPVVPFPLNNFVNRGSLSASAFYVRATNAEIAGSAFTRALLNGNNGVIAVTASVLSLSNAAISAGSDAEFHANDLLLTRTVLSTGRTNPIFGNVIPGALILDATNSLTDGGLNASNLWSVTGGFRMARRPAMPGDLLGTRIESRSGSFVQNTHQWAGLDRGNTNAGYVNNLALGRLVLDGVLLNRFRFTGASTNNALYVEYLELRTNGVPSNFSGDFIGSFAIDPGFTIYFADSNMDPIVLAGLGGGRIKWVSSYAGEEGSQSGTNLLYPNGITYRFNAALVRSMEFDTDGDNVLNGLDCTPIPVAGFDTTGQQCPAPAPAAAGLAKALAASDLHLTIALAAEGGAVVLDWDAPANSANTVEFSESLSGGAWQSLTNFINGPTGTRVTVRDAAAAPTRVYRVRVDAAKL